MSAIEKLRTARIDSHPPPRALEEVAFTSGEPFTWRDVRAHVEQCVRCQAEVAHLREDRAAFLAAHPPAFFLQDVLTRAKGRRKDGLPKEARTWPRTVGVVLTLVLATVVWWTVIVPMTVPSPPDVRAPGPAPGSQSLVLIARVSHDDAPSVPIPGESITVESGDALFFETELPKAGYVSLTSVDASGTVRRHLPQDGGAPESLPAGRQTLPVRVLVGEELEAGALRFELTFAETPTWTSPQASAQLTVSKR